LEESYPFDLDLKMCSGLGVVVNACNPITREAEAGGSQVQGQHGLHVVRPYKERD
jgi:hypothetical protein